MSGLDPERDARLFLNDVYRDQPAGTVIVVGPYTRPHYVKNTENALPYIVRKRNSFCRVTLLAGRPKRGRGKAEDAVALTGLTTDFDVNGSPDGKGGLVTGAFNGQRDAIECAHALAEPTLLVNSGYGVQPWWLLDAMEMLRSDEDRVRARSIGMAWQAAHRKLAGVEKVDSVFDLTRVMRAPGSFNGKGETPMPVVLLDNGGPRYHLDQLAALVPAIENAMPPTTIADAEVDVATILDRHRDMAKLASRDGKAPGDRSPSAWDFMLACTACEHGYEDHEIAALIVHARRTHPDDKGKEERADYIERTVAKARAKVGAAPRDRTIEQAKGTLGGVLRLERAPEGRLEVHETVLYGYGATARAVIRLSRGLTLEFERVGDISKPTRLSEELAASTGIAAEFTKNKAIRALALVREIAGQVAHNTEFLATEAVAELILRNATVEDFDLANPTERYQLWTRIQGHDPLDGALGHLDAVSYARRMILLRDRHSGAIYVRAAWAQEVMRRELGPGYTTSRVQGLFMRVGWTQPTSRGAIEATQAGQPRLRLWFYVVPNGWGES